jgi:hypothetical protein
MVLWNSWPVYTARYYLRRTWDDLPGPWWCRTLLIAACLAIPGPADEIALAAVTAACRRRRHALTHQGEKCC